MRSKSTIVFSLYSLKIPGKIIIRRKQGIIRDDLNFQAEAVHPIRVKSFDWLAAVPDPNRKAADPRSDPTWEASEEEAPYPRAIRP